MLVDAGASHVILGHSERRADHRETDALVHAKAKAAQAAGLVAVICVGETEAERDAGEEIQVIAAQLAGSVPDGSTSASTVIAYEPVWAIGSGRTPTVDQIAAVHRFMREQLTNRFRTEGEAFRLLYGGSVKPANARAIFAIPDVDGALVGGASLKAADLSAIVSAIQSRCYRYSGLAFTTFKRRISIRRRRPCGTSLNLRAVRFRALTRYNCAGLLRALPRYARVP
jgi:triosephosphate isomerase